MPEGRPSRQQAKRSWAGRCLLCGEGDQEVLDCHRVVPGNEGGTYHPRNTVVLCSNCHRRHHAGTVEILGKYLSTAGVYVVKVKVDGAEMFVPELGKWETRG